MLSRAKLLACVTLMTAPHIVWAQAAAADDQGLEDIVVTAERRETSLQRTPAAITAFSAARIQQSKVESVTDVVGRIPTLSISSPYKGQSAPALRGATSSNDSPGGDQSVGLVIDDISFSGVSEWDPALYDVERIEILRGPQGTLFGRNVVGGVINVVSKRPDDELSGSVKVDLGNYDRIDTSGRVSIPVSDTILTSLSFATANNDGTSFNRTTGRRIDDTNKRSVRGQLQYREGDFDLLLSADYARDTSSSEARKYIGPRSDVPGLDSFIPTADRRTVDQAADDGIHQTSWGVSARAALKVDGAELISITGYRHQTQKYGPADPVGVPFALFLIDSDRKTTQFSQEFRAVSDNDGPIKWVVGAYFANFRQRRAENVPFDFVPGTFFGDIQGCFRNGSDSSAFCADLFGGESVPGDPAFTRTGTSTSFQQTTTRSYAVYGQATWSLLDSLRLTGGLRYTYDKKTGRGAKGGDNNFPYLPEGPFDTRFGASWNAVTPRATAEVDLSPDHLLYATVSKGFKSGGFNLLDNAQLTREPILPETAWNYELGLKTTWFDRRLRANIAAYRVDYSNQQVQIGLDSGVVFTDNAGKVRVDGVEVEIEAAPMRGVDLWASYAYSDGKVSNFPGFNGNEPPQLPPHALSVGAAYGFDAPALGGRLRLQAEMLYKSKYYLEISNAPQFATRYDKLIDANLTYTTDDGRIALSAWGKNLTNRHVVVYGQDLWGFFLSGNEPGAEAAGSPRYAPPRTYGVSLRFNF